MKGLTTSRDDSLAMARKMTMKEIETEVAKFGNGAHVTVPKDWVGKRVRVTIIE